MISPDRFVSSPTTSGSGAVNIIVPPVDPVEAKFRMNDSNLVPSIRSRFGLWATLPPSCEARMSAREFTSTPPGADVLKSESNTSSRKPSAERTSTRTRPAVDTSGQNIRVASRFRSSFSVTSPKSLVLISTVVRDSVSKSRSVEDQSRSSHETCESMGETVLDETVSHGPSPEPSSSAPPHDMQEARGTRSRRASAAFVLGDLSDVDLRCYSRVKGTPGGSTVAPEEPPKAAAPCASEAAAGRE